MLFRIFRAALRLVAVVFMSLFLQTVWLTGKSLLQQSGSMRRRFRKFILTSWARSLAVIVGMRIKVEGQPPQPPFFLVANHLSYVDIILVASQMDCVFIAKKEISGWPGMGWLSGRIGTIFIDRKNFQDIPRVIGLIDEALNEGSGIVLFPEGTSTIGETIMPFSPALMEPAARAGYPVSYAAISYRTPLGEPPAHAAVCWWGDMDFVPHFLKLLLMSKFRATISYGEDAILADDRKVLAKSLWRAVNDQFIPVVTPSPSITRQL
ncbi:MAG: lysophospholipid acyltransferase family protein [Blastocatellia bacterium]